MKKILHLLLLPIVLATSCKKDVNDKVEFKWAKNGTLLFYDQYKNSVIAKDYLKILIIDNRFLQNGTYMKILDTEFKIKKGGLYGLYCYDHYCYCIPNQEFLYAPNQPYINQELPQYSCGTTPDFINKIIAVDTVVTVPMGTYKTYIMQHYNGDKSYWNANDGLIMYDKVDFTNRTTVIETFKLNRVE
jgi:hypothetical protein